MCGGVVLASPERHHEKGKRTSAKKEFYKNRPRARRANEAEESGATERKKRQEGEEQEWEDRGVA